MKHLVRRLVLYAIIAGSPFGVNAQTTSVCGDATGDGVVSSADIFALINRLFVDPNAPLPTMTVAQPARTGQTLCYDEAGSVIECGATGQDGATLRGGVSAQPRFVDSGDGTVSDRLTGLVWLKDADCAGSLDWNEAVSNAASLESGVCGLTDGSTPGEWRVPNIVELQSLIDFGHARPALPPEVTTTFTRLCAYCTYWSSTPVAKTPNTNFGMIFDWGAQSVLLNGLDGRGWSAAPLWPVRNPR